MKNRSTALRPARVTEPFGAVDPAEQQPFLLDFRGHNGVAVALPYAQLNSIAFRPGDCVTLEFAEHKIAIRGRNLRSLYNLLVQNRVTFVQEDDFDDAPETATFVDVITIERAPEGV